MMWPFCTCAEEAVGGNVLRGIAQRDEPTRVEQGHLVERSYQPARVGGFPACLRASAKSSADVQP